jgi:phosphate starvation-inducible protein PhoH
MIITGDLKQSDSLSNNGLRDFIEKLKRNEKELNYIKLIEMNEKDIERHPAIKEIIKIYS